MNVNNNYFFRKEVSPQSPRPASITPSFGAAKDITLKYVFDNRLRLLPQRMRNVVSNVLQKNKEQPTLRELHLRTYAPLLECGTLGKAQNLFPEFREVLQANAVIKKGSKNTREVSEHVALEDLTLHILKERWGNLKTIDELAKELGLTNRSALGWVLEKIQVPDLGKNYQALLKASDETLNKNVSEKVKAYNLANREKMLAHNRATAQDPVSKQINSDIGQLAWARLPHIREAMSEFSKTTPSQERFAGFWAKYPQYAKEYGEMKKVVAKELRKERGK